MYKKIYIFLLLKYNCFFFSIDQSSIEIFSNVFFISSVLQNTIKGIDIKNIYSLKKSTIENLNFTGNTCIIGSGEILTDIYFNNLPVISDATDYVMIDPNIMQIYIGNENNPEPPTPDIITIPNLITNQIISGDNGLYINNIDFSTQLGNKSGVITINTNEVIFNGPIESKSLFIHFNSPIIFKSNLNKVENMSAEILFCTSGIDKIYFNTLSITNPINTTKNKIYFGKSEISPGITCNGTMTINQNLNTNFGSSSNNQISILNIPIYANDNQTNINYLTLNNTNNILKGNIVPQSINQSTLSIDNNFLINEINLKENQSAHFPNKVFVTSENLSINKLSCEHFWCNTLYVQKQGINVDQFAVNNFLIINLGPGQRDFYFKSDDTYDSFFNINNMKNFYENISFNNMIYLKLKQNNQILNKMGYDTVNNKLVKIIIKVNDNGDNNKNNFHYLKLEPNELDNKIKKLELIYQKLLIICNKMGL